MNSSTDTSNVRKATAKALKKAILQVRSSVESVGLSGIRVIRRTYSTDSSTSPTRPFVPSVIASLFSPNSARPSVMPRRRRNRRTPSSSVNGSALSTTATAHFLSKSVKKIVWMQSRARVDKSIRDDAQPASASASQPYFSTLLARRTQRH